MIRTGSSVLTASVELGSDALASQTKTVPIRVPTAMSLARCPGMSEEEDGLPDLDKGVMLGDDTVDWPEKFRSGSSEAVRVAKVEPSIAWAVICTDFKPPKERADTLHSSVERRVVLFDS